MALKGIRVIEILGLAPGPLCGTILADFGASVTVVEKIQPSPFDVMSNGKRKISLNLKTKEGVEIFKKMCKKTDILLDTFRPGVMEKLGLAPESLMLENSQLIYARLTGYGQTGYYKAKAGHDINYVAMSGILSLLTKDKQPPIPPLNILADFAGGSLMCTMGILMALFERSKSGKGQVVDCSMTEGLAYLCTWIYKSQNLPIWSGEPGTNALDGGLPCYRTYKTKDGKFMSVGTLEPQFYSNLLNALHLSEDEYPQIGDADKCRKKFTELFLTKTQDEWCQIFEKADACVTPVLDIQEIDNQKYFKHTRSFYRDSNNVIVPEAAPILSRTPGESVGKKPLPSPGNHSIEILNELGFTKNDIDKLISDGHVLFTSSKSRL